MASLRERLAKVDLKKITADGVAKREAGLLPKADRTALGFHADSIYSDRKIAEENTALKAELATWAGATPAQRLDPKLIKPSKWANRHEQSFAGKEWDAFKEEISHAGGNTQPICVRPSNTSPETQVEGGVHPMNASPDASIVEGVHPMNTPAFAYEIVFGHRRHRACLELGLLVFTLVKDLTEQELFEQMDRENRQRKDLTAYEQGEMYRHALDEGLYPSMRKLSESLGVALGGVSEAVQIARLPAKVLDAFESRLDIQLRWSGPLSVALKKDPEAVLAVASAIQADRGQGRAVKSAEVLKRLTTAGLSKAAPAMSPLSLPGGAKLTVSGSGSKIKVELTGLDTGALARVKAAIVKVLGG